MSTDRWDENGNPFVDFSGDTRTKRTMANRANLTEYEGIDLASGYPRNLIWTTKDGRRIAVPHLKDSHLLNILAFLRRRVQIYKNQLSHRMLMHATASAMMFDHLPDDVLDDLTEEALKEIYKLRALSDDAFLHKCFPIWSNLYAEAQKRGILIEVDATKISRQGSKAIP